MPLLPNARSRWSVCRTAVLLLLACWSVGLIAQGADQPPVRWDGSLIPGGLGRFFCGEWSFVRGTVRNETSTDRQLRAVFAFDAAPDTQFVREFWVPANARRRVAWPVRPGESGGGAVGTAEGRGMLLAADREQVLDERNGGGVATDEPSVTLVVQEPGAPDVAAMDMVAAARSASGLDERLMFVARPRQQIPSTRIGLDGVDVLVLAHRDPQLTPAQEEAIRRWLRAGGRLWVVANRTDPEAMSRLLGRHWTLTAIDRLTTTSVRFERQEASGLPDPGQRGLAPVAVERPLAIERLAGTGFLVAVEANGWPALMSRPVGAGRLVVTAVAGPAWTDSRAEAALAAISHLVYNCGPDDLAPFRHRPASASPARPALAAAPSGQTALDAYVSQQISYRIASRAVMGGTLAAFILLLVIGAIAAYRVGRPEYLGLLGVILALATSVVLLGVGLSRRAEQGPVRAELRAVLASAGETELPTVGRLALFSPFGRELQPAGRSDAVIWPQREARRGLNRLTWDDPGRWRWTGLSLPGGSMQPYALSGPVAGARPVISSWRFDDGGLRGRVRLPNGEVPEDLALATSRANLAVAREGASADELRLRVGSDAVLPPGTVLPAVILSETQRRRADVLTEARRETNWPIRPLLTGWTDAVDGPVEWSAELERKGGTLWLMPLEITPTEPGTAVRVPWPLVEMVPLRRSPTGQRALIVYDPQEGRWLEQSFPGRFVARFNAPPAVWPLDLREATLVLDMEAAHRQVTIRDARDRVLAELSSPSGPERITLPADRLMLDGRSIVLSVDVAALSDPSLDPVTSASARWRIQRLGIELAGVVRSAAEPTAGASDE